MKTITTSADSRNLLESSDWDQHHRIMLNCHSRYLFARYRIAQGDYKDHLKGIKEHSDLVTGTIEEMASDQQRKFEALVANDNDIYEKACKGMQNRTPFVGHLLYYIDGRFVRLSAFS